MTELSANKCFGGMQKVFSHSSRSTGTEMTLGLYLPPQVREGPVPLIVFLAGLTCTHENAMVKAGAQRLCADIGLAFMTPDTSPRGLELDGEHDRYDFGSGAGFYLDATEAPWAENYRMYSYVAHELPELVLTEFAEIDAGRLGLTGHSMGGHGALTIGLKNPDRFKSVSALAPIASPINCPWGQNALPRYIGDNKGVWRQYDACALIEDGHRVPEIMVDQGLNDEFMNSQLKPDLLERACSDHGQSLQMRYQEGYDHSYFFISSFLGDHLHWAADHLQAT
ncbi:MAG: S-formylglutathione hydrolase [Pseudomonadota bacterium]